MIQAVVDRAGKDAHTKMRIITWNLWGRFGPWPARKEAIATTLAEVRPDLCGLQEVWLTDDQNIAAELADRLGMSWCWKMASRTKLAGGDDVRIGNAILSRWPILADATVILPVADATEGRVAVHARVQAPGGVLPMFTTHLTHHPGASQIRVAQVRQVAAFIAEHSAHCAYPPVVTGDFNAEPASDELRLLGGILTAPVVPGQVLVDAWRYVDPADPGFTMDRANGYRQASQIPDSRIDYILVGLPKQGRGRVQSARLAGCGPVDGVWPSDHFAVVADIQE